jgi:hypothetical protein
MRGELPGQEHLSPAPAQVQQVQAAAPAPLQIEEEKPPAPAAPSPVPCRYCNCSMQPASKFCHECGKGMQVETNIWKVCPDCDAVTSDDAVYCTACRQKFPEDFLK